MNYVGLGENDYNNGLSRRKCVKKIIGEIKWPDNKPPFAGSAKKAEKEYSHTKAYIEEGVSKSGAGKTDIVFKIGTEQKKSFCLKKMGGAQYASVQGPEARCYF